MVKCAKDYFMAGILVSACLCGIPCRYDGRSKPVDRFVEMLRCGECIPFCPEKLGGLTTPREPAVLSGGDGFSVLDGAAKVILSDTDGDVTDEFIRGAELSVMYASSLNPESIYLKEKSPSCGVRRGVNMPGVAAAALIRSGFRVEAVD
ncbi:MAG: DUF523 domain-containing protein [Candidatus Aegiribacteria sp.]|nr:DUF523 domain-containing protein [Candidatus Aegiribacteria sp.]